MIVCSCAVISTRDIESALIDILNQPDAPIPTPGIVFRHLERKMKCCGCAPLTIEVIYDTMRDLIERGLICRDVGEKVSGSLLRLVPKRREACEQIGLELSALAKAS